MHRWVDELIEGCDLEEGDLVLDAVLIARVTRIDAPEGLSSVAVSRTKGCDWVVQAGLLAAAQGIMASGDPWQSRNDQ